MRKSQLFEVVLILLFLSLLLMLFGCATWKLERKLEFEFRAWYDLHSILMDTKVPEWIDESSPSERAHFLRLPAKMKQKYIEYFWKIRSRGAEEIFYSRVEYANVVFDKEGLTGWRTDRGRVLILCGEPTFIRYYCEGRLTLPADDSISMFSSNYIQVWSYPSFYAEYVFQFYPPTGWKRAINSLYSGGNNVSFERYWKDKLAPVDWNTWASVLLEWVHEKEKKK